MRKTLSWNALVLASGILLVSPAVPAATFNVSNGSQLQDALTTAQNNNEGDTIILAAGNYDAAGGTFTYEADSTLGSEENFPLTLQGDPAGGSILDGGDLTQVMSLSSILLTADGNADFRIENLTFQNGNSSLSGAGLLVVTNDGDVTLLGSKFDDNNSSDFAGGADLQSGVNGGAGSQFIDGNLFMDNFSANEIGAAEFIVDQGQVVATNNIFFNNESGADNGSVFIQFFSGVGGGGPLTFVNNTVVQNRGGDDNGGAYIAVNAGQVANVYNNIFFGNFAQEPGGEDLFVEVGGGSTLNLFNNDIGHLCFGSGNCDPSANPGVNFGANLNVDPQLVGPADADFSPALGSPVIDAGDPAAPNLPTLDFLGNPRIVGPAPDMGAVEALPDISVDPGTLFFFGEETQILTITNLGAGTLEISGFVLSSNSNFSLDPNQGNEPCGSLTPSLAGGERCTLGIVLTQTVDIDETLRIDSNDPDEPQLMVSLSDNSGNDGGCSLGNGGNSALWAVLAMLALLGLARRIRRFS